MAYLTNPYKSKGAAQFWRTAVSSVEPSSILPLRPKRFALADGDIIATAGSCFAQNLAKRLRAHPSVRFLQTEFIADNQPLFSALYGNIYSASQLAQLFDESFGRRTPSMVALRRSDGRYVDALRPNVFEAGFATEDHVSRARADHLAAVRRVFSECTVLVFTLGLTESWRSRKDGTVYPLAPTVFSSEAADDECEFHNANFRETTEDMRRFSEAFFRVNPDARMILTVSPVPLAATYSDEHVLVATAHSKAILRAACAELEEVNDAIYYFPAYEIISAPFAGGAYYEADLRTVTRKGIDHVMKAFDANYLASKGENVVSDRPRSSSNLFSQNEHRVVCDEEGLTKSIGF